MFRRALASVVLSLSLVACAAGPRPGPAVADAPPTPEPTWAFEASDIEPDPAFRFGQLANGMRYVIRPNATPAGTALVRMDIAAGSLDERADELGYAHFVEHMAFNGSTRVPEGEMVRLLERNGLKFGADTNASTSFEFTDYRLDLPRNDPALLDVALMLMRETASELTISDEAVARERGVVLSELRDRTTYALKNAIDSAEFSYPQAYYTSRFPIGTVDTLNAATGAKLRAFWSREYVPAQTTLVVVGDFDADLVEQAIERHFASWQAAPAEPQPDAGPVDFSDKGRTHVYLDPALPERIEIERHGPYMDEPDNADARREKLLRAIGYGIVNRRFQRISREDNAPFQGAGFGTGDVFEAARSTRLIVDVPDRKWRRGLTAAALEYRRAMRDGFAQAEVDEQLANTRTAIENAASAADTRSNAALVEAAFGLIRKGQVPSHPQAALERFNSYAEGITPLDVMAALRREALALEDPLIRFRGRYAPKGGAKAVRDAWDAAMRSRLGEATAAQSSEFAYTDFGPAGELVARSETPELGITTMRFANGVRLNLKRTALEQDRVLVRLNIDGGRKLDTREEPLGTDMMGYFATGGLGKHSQDELQSVFAGKTVSARFAAGGNSFVATARTTPRDLEAQLQLLAAYVTDPGYRADGEVQYRHAINRFFAQRRATPAATLRSEQDGILSAGDPRFALQAPEAYRALSFDDLRAAISESLASGALEIGIVGDIDPEVATAVVAKTFGALPQRQAEFSDWSGLPPRVFPEDRQRRVLRHEGEADQAIVRLNWPTRDDSDPEETLALELLEEVTRIALVEELREALGQAYSPGASSAPSRDWPGYGTFAVAASVDLAQVPAARAAMIAVIENLRREGPDADLVDRARKPLLEQLRNALKSNAGWLALVDRAQSEPERIERYSRASQRIEALRAADVQAMAQKYLDPAQALEILVIPEGAEQPAL